jgi:Tol biopolymer transport system component
VKDEEILLKSSENKHPTSWSRDGRFLLYTVAHAKGKSEIRVLPMAGDNKPVPFLITEFNEGQARFSPDSHWVAYTSDESGHDEVYVRSFSVNSAGTVAEASGKWQVSNRGGNFPRWRNDGRELYYRSPGDGKVMAVEIATSPVFRAGKPQPLGLVLPGAWDSADGKRFLAAVSPDGPQPDTVVLNWQAGLKK